MDNDENNWIKSVLNVINPKDGTDYWLGGLDANRDGDRKDHGMYWMTGNFLNYLFSFQISTTKTAVFFETVVLLTPTKSQNPTNCG